MIVLRFTFEGSFTMIEVNLAAAIVVALLVVVITIVLSLRIGLGTAAKFVQSLLASPVIMAAISSLEKSVPSTVIDILLGGLDLGEASTTSADLKALLDAIEQLIRENKTTQTLLMNQGAVLTQTSPSTVINMQQPMEANQSSNVVNLTPPLNATTKTGDVYTTDSGVNEQAGSSGVG